MELINVNKTWLNLLVLLPLRFYKDLAFFSKWEGILSLAEYFDYFQ